LPITEEISNGYMFAMAKTIGTTLIVWSNDYINTHYVLHFK